MPHTETYNEKGSQQQGSPLSLVELIAYARPTTSGLAAYMTKTLIVSGAMATVSGITATFVLAPVFGPLLPFLAGTMTGFTAGIAQRWFFDTREALDALEAYPELMEYHLRQLPKGGRGGLGPTEPYAAWRAEVGSDTWKQCMAVLAMYGASSSIAALKKAEEEAIVERLTIAGLRKVDEEERLKGSSTGSGSGSRFADSRASGSYPSEGQRGAAGAQLHVMAAAAGDGAGGAAVGARAGQELR